MTTTATPSPQAEEFMRVVEGLRDRIRRDAQIEIDAIIADEAWQNDPRPLTYVSGPFDFPQHVALNRAARREAPLLLKRMAEEAGFKC